VESRTRRVALTDEPTILHRPVNPESMNPLPSLSIVTISFNQARFLEACIQSVVTQKTDGIEYIVVDPGSTDSSRDILEKSRPEIDNLILEPDAGPADGLNKGFAVATGDIFGYINADDRFVAGTFEFVRRYFVAHPEVDVLCGAIRIIDQNDRISLRARAADQFNVRRYAAGVCIVGQQATFFRRTAFERVGGFNVANRVAWDGELLADFGLAEMNFATVRKILGDFRVYRGTISNSGHSYMEKLYAYHSNLEYKLRDKGFEPYPPAWLKMVRLAYQMNPLRHLNNLLVRWN
jgi:glycosyltransferase involved in cell wall biosynthesis